MIVCSQYKPVYYLTILESSVSEILEIFGDVFDSIFFMSLKQPNIDTYLIER